MELTRSNQTSNSYYLKPDAQQQVAHQLELQREFSVAAGQPVERVPSPMMLMRTVELSGQCQRRSDLAQHLRAINLVATGSTYHDIGMIWGGRLTSPEGLFADNVNLDADKINVSKHIIFMTDGIMEPTASGYSAYGIENLDHRIAPSGYEGVITARHDARFDRRCASAIKAQGTTIWVVAFSCNT